MDYYSEKYDNYDDFPLNGKISSKGGTKNKIKKDKNDGVYSSKHVRRVTSISLAPK